MRSLVRSVGRAFGLVRRPSERALSSKELRVAVLKALGGAGLLTLGFGVLFSLIDGDGVTFAAVLANGWLFGLVMLPFWIGANLRRAREVDRDPLGPR